MQREKAQNPAHMKNRISYPIIGSKYLFTKKPVSVERPKAEPTNAKALVPDLFLINRITLLHKYAHTLSGTLQNELLRKK